MTVEPKTPLLTAKRQVADHLLRPDSHSNALAIGIKDEKVRIYVQSLALGVDRICESFDGVESSVTEIGRFGILNRGPQGPQKIGPGLPIRFQTTRPNVNQRAIGTLGAVLRYDDEYYILSCNHVLAVDGRVPADTPIVTVEVRSLEIARFPGNGYFVPIGGASVSPADCALATVTLGALREAFVPVGKLEPIPDMKVKKYGAITGLTTGTIIDTVVDARVDYSIGTFRFNDHILIAGDDGKEFAWEGDSGSIVVESKTEQPVAMVFAETGRYAFACPLSTIFRELGKLPRFQGKTPEISMASLP
jgi:hypothetical protein